MPARDHDNQCKLNASSINTWSFTYKYKYSRLYAYNILRKHNNNIKNENYNLQTYHVWLPS